MSGGDLPSLESSHAAQTDTGDPEDWPTPIGTLGKVWACRTVADAHLREPLVLVVTNPPAGDEFKRQGMATVYTPATFRALVAKMQQIADSLPAEGSPT